MISVCKAIQRATPNQRTCILKCMIAITHSLAHIHVQYSAFSLTYNSIFFRSVVLLTCLPVSYGKKIHLCMNVYFSLSLWSFYPFLLVYDRVSRVRTRAHTKNNTTHYTSAKFIYSLCLSAVLCFYFVKLIRCLFFWMNWVNGFCIVYVYILYVLCIMRKSGSSLLLLV